MTHACNVHRLENVDVRSKVLKCEEVLYMCMHMEYTYVYVYLHITILLSLLLDYSIYILKMIIAPSQMGAYWSYQLTISYDARCEATSPSAKRERGYSKTLEASGTSAA